MQALFRWYTVTAKWLICCVQCQTLEGTTTCSTHLFNLTLFIAMDVLIWAWNGQRMCIENIWLPESKGNALAQAAAEAAGMVPLTHTEGKGNGADKCDSNTLKFWDYFPLRSCPPSSSACCCGYWLKPQRPNKIWQGAGQDLVKMQRSSRALGSVRWQ